MNLGKKTPFIIRLKGGERYRVQGYPVALVGLLAGMPGSYGVHEVRAKHWHVTNLETGALVCKGGSMTGALDELIRLALEKGMVAFRRQIAWKRLQQKIEEQSPGAL